MDYGSTFLFSISYAFFEEAFLWHVMALFPSESYDIFVNLYAYPINAKGVMRRKVRFYYCELFFLNYLVFTLHFLV